jgi:drug/metabolite transporter (DMT)-like permease
VTLRRHNAELLLLLITVLWGGTFAIVKDSLNTTSPATFVLLRFGIAAVLSLLLWPAALKTWDTTVHTRGAILGFLYGIGFLLQTIGLTLTTASSSAFITGTMVVFVPFVYYIVERRRIRWFHTASILSVVLGLWLFTAPEHVGVNAGDLVTLLSAILWAVYLTYIDLWTTEWRAEPQRLNALVQLQFIMTSILAVSMIYFMEGGSLQLTWSSDLILSLLYCAVAASVVATWVQTRFQQFTDPVRAAVIYAVEPLAAAAIAWVMLHERLTPRELVGAAVLIAGIVVPDLIASRREAA